MPNSLKILLCILGLLIVHSQSQNIYPCDEIACNCILNSENKKVCDKCRDGFKKDTNNNCVFDSNQVQIIGQNSVIVRNCLSQTNNSCNQCVSGYSQTYQCYNYCGYLCLFYCQYNGANYQNHTDCKPYCNLQNCSYCSYNYSQECLKCDESTYLYNKQCVQQCPENTTPNSNRECIPCSVKCQTCSSNSQCASCVIPSIQSLPTCDCPQNQYFFNKQCISECPLYYQKNITQGVCERQCPANSYPLPNSQTQKIDCVSPTSSDSDFCLYHLKNLSNLVSFRLQSNGDSTSSSYYTLIAKFQQTPKICYQFLLFGKDNFQIQISNTNELLDYTEFYYQFSKQDFDNPNYFSCGVKSCEFKLKIQWGNQIQYIFKTNVNLNITGYLSNEVILNGDYKIVDVVCEDCVIPRDSVIKSTLQSNCSSGQVCTDSSIFANINSIITITQKIIDPLFVNNQLEPHSIKLDYNNNGYQATIYIKSYNYTNNVLGQITYSFITMGVQNGKLTITSVVKNAKVGRILSETSGQKVDVKYPQLSFDLQMKEVFNDQQEAIQKGGNSSNDNQTTYIIIIVVLCLSFLIGVGTYCLYKRYKKNQQKKQKITESQIQKEVVKQEPSNTELQQQQDVEQNKLKIEKQTNYIDEPQIQIQIVVEKPELIQQSYEKEEKLSKSSRINEAINFEKESKNEVINFEQESKNEIEQSAQVIILNEEEENEEDN